MPRFAMSVGSVLSAAWELLRWGWRRWLVVSLVASAAFESAYRAVGGTWEWVLLFLAFPALTGLVAALIAADVKHREESRWGRVSRAVGRLLPIAAVVAIVSVVAAIGFGVGLLFLIVPGLILLARWSVVIPVLVWEGSGFWDAFRRSNRLVRGHTGVVLVAVLVPIVFAIPAGLGDPGSTAGLVFLVLVDALLTLVAAAIAIALYEQLVTSTVETEPLYGDQLRAPSDLTA